jgi:hypothetical protein
VAGGADSRRLVDVHADGPLLGDDGRARVEAHPYCDRAGAEALLRLGGRSRGRHRIGKGDEEGIALGVDLGTALPLERGPEHAPVLRERASIPFRPELAQEQRGALDVGEKVTVPRGSSGTARDLSPDTALRFARALHLLDRRTPLLVHQATRRVDVRLGLWRGLGRLRRHSELAPQLLRAGIGIGSGGRAARGSAPAKELDRCQPCEDAGGQCEDSARSRFVSVRVRHEDDTILPLYSLHFLPRSAPTFPRGARDGGAA